MIPERPTGPRRVAEAHQEATDLTSWDGLAIRSIPGVEVRVEYEAGGTRSALDALDNVAHRVRSQIVDDEGMMPLGPQDEAPHGGEEGRTR